MATTLIARKEPTGTEWAGRTQGDGANKMGKKAVGGMTWGMCIREQLECVGGIKAQHGTNINSLHLSFLSYMLHTVDHTGGVWGGENE